MGAHIDDSLELDLRTRRRQATLHEISDAALELFERQGLGSTTVDEIARLAGVSPRTFFRYFPSKEDAVFVDEEFVDTVIDQAFTAIESGAAAVVALDRAWAHVVSEFESNERQRERYVRVRRLIAAEPTLLAAALARDATRAEDMTNRLVKAGERPAEILAARATLEFIGSTVRLSFSEWARAADKGQPEPITVIYSRVRKALLASALALCTDQTR